MSELRQRLVAILAADAAGYSRLMSLDEHGTVAALDAARAVFRQRIEGSGGRVIDMAGDSVLAVFETAVGAVQAALAVQQQLAQAMAATPEAQRLRFRIGIHVGDVIEKDDGSVYGDGVNIAARLQALAEPGGVVVSQAVHGMVARVDAGFEDIGEQSVKNIARPVRAYRVAPANDAALAAPAAAAALRPPPRRGRRIALVASLLGLGLLGLALVFGSVAGWRPWQALTGPGAQAPAAQKSIAVLPFASLSEDKSNEYFADGMADELHGLLSRLPGLKVIARSSAAQFKGQGAAASQAGRQLGVSYLVEGSVRKAGDRVRIAAQLTNAADGVTLWSQSYDREVKDVFALQLEMARLIARALQLRITADDLKGSGTSDPEAWRLFQEAQQQLEAANALAIPAREALPGIEQQFQRAIQRDPRFARAMVGLARTWSASMARTRPADLAAGERRERARIEAKLREALAIDPTLVEAQLMLVGAQGDGWLREADLAVFRTLAEANPNDVRAQRVLFLTLAENGMMSEALLAMERVQALDPISPATLNSATTLNLHAGRLDPAMAAVSQALVLLPESSILNGQRALLLAYAGRRDEAAALAGGKASGTYYAMRTMALLGDRSLIQQVLDRPGIREPGVFGLPYALALAGRHDEALTALANCQLRAGDYYARVLYEPAWDPTRADPRFRALLDGLGLSAAHDRAQAWRAAHPPTRPMPL
jgi:adenylate cyclase